MYVYEALAERGAHGRPESVDTKHRHTDKARLMRRESTRRKSARGREWGERSLWAGGDSPLLQAGREMGPDAQEELGELERLGRSISSA